MTGSVTITQPPVLSAAAISTNEIEEFLDKVSETRTVGKGEVGQ